MALLFLFTVMLNYVTTISFEKSETLCSELSGFGIPLLCRDRFDPWGSTLAWEIPRLNQTLDRLGLAQIPDQDPDQPLESWVRSKSVPLPRDRPENDATHRIINSLFKPCWHLESISPTFYEQLVQTCRSQSAKKTESLTVFFALLGSASIKASSKMLVKSTPWVNFINIFLPQTRWGSLL